jgi:hypothetical protein
MRGRRSGRCGIGAACAVGVIAACVARAGAGEGAHVAAGSELAALLDAAGIVRHLEEWPEANVVARESARVSLDPEAFALLMREVATAFAPDALRERVAASLTASVSAAGAVSLRDGYAHTRSVDLLGPAAGLSASDLRDFPRFASAVSRRQLDPARLALVARLDAATGFGRNAWRVTGAWAEAIERGARVLRCEKAAWEAPLSPQASAERRHLAGPFRERVHLELLFLVRTQVPPDLRRTVEFLETGPARAFHRAVGEAAASALADALTGLRTQLAAPAAQRCADPPPARSRVPERAAGR